MIKRAADRDPLQELEISLLLLRQFCQPTTIIQKASTNTISMHTACADYILQAQPGDFLLDTSACLLSPLFRPVELRSPLPWHHPAPATSMVGVSSSLIAIWVVIAIWVPDSYLGRDHSRQHRGERDVYC
jgi:hypothetical protein